MLCSCLVQDLALWNTTVSVVNFTILKSVTKVAWDFEAHALRERSGLICSVAKSANVAKLVILEESR